MVRLLFRLIGLALFLLAIAFFVRDLYVRLDTGLFEPAPLGQYWYGWSPGSLNLTQAVIQRYVWPPLWDSVLQPILEMPAFLPLGILGLLLLLVTRRRRSRRRR